MFDKSAAIPLNNAVQGSPPRAVMAVNGVTMAFPMVNISKGNQGSRLQTDVSLGGDVFVTGSVQGVGTYYLQFWDAPTLGSATDYGGWQRKWYNVVTKQGRLEFSAVKQMLHMTSVKERVAVVRLFAGEDACGEKSEGFEGWLRGDKALDTNIGNMIGNAAKWVWNNNTLLRYGASIASFGLISSDKKSYSKVFTANSTPLAIFKGVVTDINLELAEHEGMRSILTQLTLVGAWGIDEPKFTFSFFS